MKLNINRIIVVSLSVLIFGCTSPTNSDSTYENTHTENTQPNKSIESENTPPKNECNCSDEDANRLTSKILSNFRNVQDQLESNIARRMESYGPLDKRENCTWVVTFKISWPFGNTDGAHPDEFIKKRFACDGKEIYVQ